MDPRGLRARLTGAGCTACGTAIPVDRIVLLADRGDLAFVELACAACGSRSLGVVVADGPEPSDPVLDIAVHPEIDPETAARDAARRPMDHDDVTAMHRLLAGWDGDVRTLLDARRGTADRAAPGQRHRPPRWIRPAGGLR